ncbi:MAG: DUF922 domain-containing protein [Pseudomonadota bacterium]
MTKRSHYRYRRTTGILATTLALSTGWFCAPVSAQSFADYPDTEIRYYWVEGMTGAELRAELEERGPLGNDGATVDATASYYLEWQLSSAGPRLCNADITITTWVIFPRHRNPDALPPETRARWLANIAALEAHEMGHIEMAYDALPDLRRALENGSCEGANRRADAVMSRLRRAQEAYDQQTDHGRKTGAHFP